MPFDPFSSGAAVAIDAKPTGFDPFSSGQAVANAPEVTAEPEGEGPTSAPNVGTHWDRLYAGLVGLDDRLNPEEKASFARLDTLSDNAKSSRAQAINQAYLQSQLAEISHGTMERNWPAIKDAYAKLEFGMVDTNISDVTLYGAISKRLQENRETDLAVTGEIKPWTWQQGFKGDLRMKSAQLGNFWEAINKPAWKLPLAPKDLPDIPSLAQYNPAVAGGVWNTVAPIVDQALGSPLGIATLGAGPALASASKTYPLAKAALVSMTGIFTGLMGYGTAKAAIKAPSILKDPNASTEDKVTALADPVAQAAATLLGAMGVAFELFPHEKSVAVAKELDGKNPAQGAEIMRREAEQTDIPQHSDFLRDVAYQFDNIAKVEDKEAVKNPTETPVGGNPASAREPIQSAPTPETPPASEPSREPVSTPALAEESALETKETGATGIKNETVDAELDRMGKEASKHGEATTEKAENAKAADILDKDPEAANRLVEQLSERPREISATEVALLTREAVKRRLERAAAEEEFNGAREHGDQADMMDAKLRIARAQDAYAKAADAMTLAGTKQAQAFRMRQMMLKEDYSLAAIERRRQVAQGGEPLTEAQQSEVVGLHKKLTEAQARIDAYEAQKRSAAAEPVREAPRRAKPTSRVSQFITDQATAARSRIKARMAEGRVQSGLDPQDLADHAIIGAEYIAKGVTKFTDWSAAMVNELGEAIRPHLQEIFKQAIEAKDQASKLQAYKTRKITETERLQEKLKSGDFTKEDRKKLTLDPEAQRLRADYERVKRKVQLGEIQAENAQRTPVQKVRSTFHKWVRFGALSYPTVFVKLTSAALARFATTPLEQLAGLAISKTLPALAERGRMESVSSFSGMVRAESKAMTEGLTTGMKGAWDMLNNRDTELQTLLEKEHLPPELIEYLGKLHGAFKQPTQINDFARRLQLITEQDLRKGVDVTHPVEQLRLMHEAYAYSKRAVFLQDNGVVNAYRATIRTLEANQKATGKPSAALQLLSTGLQTELPIVKVPTNVVAEISEALTGSLQGPVRAAWAYAKGIENLNVGEADQILRLMKKGSIGAAFLALGYFKAKQFGGFYQSGEKRKPGQLQPGEAKAGAVTIPKAALHNPFAEVAQYGATVRNVSDELIKKAGGDPKGPLSGLLGASIGLLDEVPFVRETTTLGKYADSREALPAIDAKAASILVPGLVQWIAAQTDKKTPFSPTENPHPRKAGDLKQAVEKDVPGLREKLPSKSGGPAFRN